MGHRLVILGLLMLVVLASCEKDNPEPDCTDCDVSHFPYNPIPFEVAIPQDFPQLEIPADNPLTVDGVALGRRLFYDLRLSQDSSISCASCHLSGKSFTDGNAFSKGITGELGRRSSMSLLNVGYVSTGLFWDGRAATLEEQALLPVEDPVEMHETWGNVITKLQGDPDYPRWFRAAFGIKDKREMTKFLAAKAIAQFERTMVSGNSRYDEVFIRGEGFPTDSELNGFTMFFDFSPQLPDAECGHCHGGILFTGHGFFNNAIDSVGSLLDFQDRGRGVVTGNYLDNGRFRAPSLRNIALTAPYMHDGRFQTLEEVVDHYNSGGHIVENYDANMRVLNLTAQQKTDLINFLHTLTDTSLINKPEFQDPWK